MKLITALLLGAKLVEMTAGAQTHQHAPLPEGKATDLGKLPAPQKIEGIGQAHIPITTKSPQAQDWFDQGLALLHCFWHYESERAFEEAIRLDPDCAMCHWGLSQAADGNGDSRCRQS